MPCRIEEEKVTALLSTRHLASMNFFAFFLCALCVFARKSWLRAKTQRAQRKNAKKESIQNGECTKAILSVASGRFPASK
jgi:hypothetical protein